MIAGSLVSDDRPGRAQEAQLRSAILLSILRNYVEQDEQDRLKAEWQGACETATGGALN